MNHRQQKPLFIVDNLKGLLRFERVKELLTHFLVLDIGLAVSVLVDILSQLFQKLRSLIVHEHLVIVAQYEALVHRDVHRVHRASLLAEVYVVVGRRLLLLLLLYATKGRKRTHWVGLMLMKRPCI